VARETLGNEVLHAVPQWRRRQRLPRAALPGARLFATSGCTTCHTYLGSGSRNVGAPDLSRVGRSLGVSFIERYVADPRQFGDFVMPKFAGLGAANVHRIAVFLAASKGPR
jgi:cbb3-type cytochrome oxidase cytochrome c subunit